jgi:hypothetical protein
VERASIVVRRVLLHSWIAPCALSTGLIDTSSRSFTVEPGVREARLAP